MNFKSFLHEAIIIPPKLKITTTDIKKLNKQFKDTIISFELSDGGPHAAYVPELEVVKVYVDPEMTPKVLEALIQHELIHVEQDKKSGMRMGPQIAKNFKKLKEIEEYIEDTDEDEVEPEVLKAYEDIVKDMDFLNDEERMVYAYMFVKLRPSDNIKDAIKFMNDEWIKWTNKKPTKKMSKYFASYWMVKDKL